VAIADDFRAEIRSSYLLGLSMRPCVLKESIGKEVMKMASKGTNSPAKKTTSAAVASKAAKILRDPKATKAEKSAAASALAQHPAN
jgi:hypothetical protein